MQRSRIGTLSLIVAAAALAVAGGARSQEGKSAPAADAKAQTVDKVKGDGKALFLEFKCNGCHAVQAAGVEAKKIAGEEPDPKEKPPDLSNVGAKKDAAWMRKYLMKQEKLEGKLHKKKFRGTPEQLATITDWLATQKTGKGGAK
ncbi:MAG: c-type cytochrome [Candidatus Eiseniibacteriota bacterium]